MPKIVVDASEVYELSEAAQELSISIATLFRRMKSGKIIPIRFGTRTFIPLSEIQRHQKGANAKPSVD